MFLIGYHSVMPTLQTKVSYEKDRVERKTSMSRWLTGPEMPLGTEGLA